jgi:LCP family protein required for cell wall assembly
MTLPTLPSGTKKVKAGDRGLPKYPPATMMRVKNQSHPQLHQWFRVLMATFMICSALAVGSIVGVMARTFMPNPEQWVKVPIEGRPGEYKLVKAEGKQMLVNPWDVLAPFNNLDRKVNILILGSDYNYVRGKKVNDQQAGTRSRTDTIMLASLDPATRKISLLSIPRDTRAMLTGYHIDKINAAMTYGGVDLVKSTVSDLTGVPIDYYMALKVDGLINTVDILGGIKIYVEKDMHYQDDTAHLGINIHKGWKERMNGEQAHGYIRFRKDELGDIGRVQRQQKFINAVVDKLLQPESWLKIPALMQHLNENIETDVPSDVIGQMVRFSTGLKKQDIRMVMLPGTFANIGGISYWEMSSYLAPRVIGELFPESSLAPAPDAVTTTGEPENPYAKYRVTVWNATKDLQVGREVVRRLREAGWNVWAIQRAPHDAPKTRFIAQTGKSDLLPALQSAVGFNAGEQVTASVGDIGSDFTVLINEDIATYLHSTMNTEDWTRAEKAPLPNTPTYQSRRRSRPQQSTQIQAPVQPAQAIRHQQPLAHAQQPAVQNQVQDQTPAQTQLQNQVQTQVQMQVPAQQAPAAQTQPIPAVDVKPRFRQLGNEQPAAPAAPAEAQVQDRDPLYD